MGLRKLLLPLAFCLAGGAVQAEVESDVQALCQRAAKNQGIFEMLLIDTVARSGPEPGAFTCTWTFEGGPYGPGTLTAEMTTTLLRSEAAARLAIETARLPENHRGKTIEALAKIGDSGNIRTIVDNGLTRLVEVEAVKGRRYFLMTVRTTSERGLSPRAPWQSVNFLGIGLHQI